MRRLACRDLLEGGAPDDDASIDGAELQKLYWALKQREKDLARRERYWASINEGLTNAFAELETQAKELRELREELVRVNAGLEARVAAQVAEIVQQASEVDALSVQLKERVRERSRELKRALDRADVDVSSLAEGAVVGGRARIVAKLGEGAMGSVYEAEDLLTNRRVALKLLRAANRKSLSLFVAEADAASAVHHPAIVRTLHIDAAEDGTLYQLMDLVRGVTLRSQLEAGSFRFGEAARIGGALAAALAAAHAERVVHRDIKPENILLSVDAPGVRILDFGVAKQIADGGETDSRHVVAGTPGYMAPDQIRPSGATTTAVDVYSLGVVLFELVTGRRPFHKKRVEDVLVAHLYAAPPALGGPPELADVVAQCLEKQPSARPTAADLAVRLERFADAENAPSADVIGREAALRQNPALG